MFNELDEKTAIRSAHSANIGAEPNAFAAFQLNTDRNNKNTTKKDVDIF